MARIKKPDGKWVAEFKKFALRGNVFDMAIGLVIGSAFTAIVNSVVNDLIMPLIGRATNGMDFTEKYIALDGNSYESLAQAAESTAVFRYGNFIQVVANFVIIAFSLFLVVQAISKLQDSFKAKEEAEPEPEPERLCPYCFVSIDDRATRCPHCTSPLPELEAIAEDVVD